MIGHSGRSAVRANKSMSPGSWRQSAREARGDIAKHIIGHAVNCQRGCSGVGNRDAVTETWIRAGERRATGRTAVRKAGITAIVRRAGYEFRRLDGAREDRITGRNGGTWIAGIIRIAMRD